MANDPIEVMSISGNLGMMRTIFSRLVSGEAGGSFFGRIQKGGAFDEHRITIRVNNPKRKLKVELANYFEIDTLNRARIKNAANEWEYQDSFPIGIRVYQAGTITVKDLRFISHVFAQSGSDDYIADICFYDDGNASVCVDANDYGNYPLFWYEFGENEWKEEIKGQ